MTAMNWHELGLAIAQAETPSIALEQEVARKLGANPRTRYMQDFPAARSVLPQGWGYVLDATPNRPAWCDAIGPARVGSNAWSDVAALLAAACMAQSYVENRAIRDARELEARRARAQVQPPQDAPANAD